MGEALDLAASNQALGDSWGPSLRGPLRAEVPVHLLQLEALFQAFQAAPAEKVLSGVRVVSVPHPCGRLPLPPPGMEGFEALLPKFLWTDCMTTRAGLSVPGSAATRNISFFLISGPLTQHSSPVGLTPFPPVAKVAGMCLALSLRSYL